MHFVARIAWPLQKVVALGDAQADPLTVVALRGVAQSFESRPRLCVPFAAEEPLGAPELQLVAVVPRRDRLEIREGVELRAGERRQVAQRKLVVDARERLARFLGVARRARRAAQPHQHLVGHGGLRERQALVDGCRAGLIA